MVIQWLPLKPRADRYIFASHPEHLSVAAKRFSSSLVINRSREPSMRVSLRNLPVSHSPIPSVSAFSIQIHMYVSPNYLCHTMGLFHLRSPSSIRTQILFILRSRPYSISLHTHFSFHICDLASIAKPYHSHHLQPDSASPSQPKG